MKRGAMIRDGARSTAHVTTTTAAIDSYSTIAEDYDSIANEMSFWGTLAREFYESIVLKPSYGVAVDLGCGTGTALSHLRTRASSETMLIGIEPAEPMRRVAEARCAGVAGVEFREGRFEAIPLPAASVDYLYSIWALHWISDPERAAAEIRRVLSADGEMDLWFAGLHTGGEFSRKVSEVLRRYGGLEACLRAASVATPFDRSLVERLFSFLGPAGLTITEETTTHYDTLDAHWAWQLRSEAYYSVVAPADRGRFEAELRCALATLEDEWGIPYTRHSFHVRYRHVERPRRVVDLPGHSSEGIASAEATKTTRMSPAWNERLAAIPSG